MRPVPQRVEAEEVVLQERARGQAQPSQEGGVEDALPVALRRKGLHGEIEEREEDQLLRALVRGQGVGGEGGGEERPDGEGEDRPVEGGPLQARAAPPQAQQEHDDGQGEPYGLGGEDGDRARGRDGGHEAELHPVQAAQLRPRLSPPRAA